MSEQHEIELRVRYQETDAMGRVHHANYINYFEVGRIELLRATGRDYRWLEDEGLHLVVSELSFLKNLSFVVMRPQTYPFPSSKGKLF